MIDIKKLTKKVAKNKKTIVFPEAGFCERMVEVGKIINKKKIANVVFVGDESAFVLKYKHLEGITIINPKTHDLLDEFARIIYEKRKHKGISLEDAKNEALDPICFGTMLVECGVADCMVAGTATSTANVLRPALRLAKKTSDHICSCNILYGKNKAFDGGNGLLILSDCGLVINPSAQQIAQSAISSANTLKKLFNIKPKVALLSYSTHKSADGESAEKMRQVVQILKEKQVDFQFDGEFQFDTAINLSTRLKKCANSSLEGQANVLIFPDLASANICYKALESFGGLCNIGPITQGFENPINDASRGATIKDILELCIITLLQVK